MVTRGGREEKLHRLTESLKKTDQHHEQELQKGNQPLWKRKKGSSLPHSSAQKEGPADANMDSEEPIRLTFVRRASSHKEALQRSRRRRL